MKTSSFTVSVPAKIHLLGEHAAVYGKPALLTAVDRRLSVTVGSSDHSKDSEEHLPLRQIIEPIIIKELNIKKIPPYTLTISSQIPIGCGLGSSAAISASFIAALLLFLKIKWDVELVNKLAFEAEKVFHGNPSGGDNAAVCFGGLIWFQKISQDEKIIKQLQFSIPENLSRNFVLIDSGKPVESTGEMVGSVQSLKLEKPEIVDRFLDDQEKLTQELVEVIKNGDEGKFIRIIREGEKNLERIGVVSEFVNKIIREIEDTGGAAKISGGGGKTKGTGILLAYHSDVSIIKAIANRNKLSCFQTKLGVEGLRKE